jgi:hypothetical protein
MFRSSSWWERTFICVVWTLTDRGGAEPARAGDAAAAGRRARPLAPHAGHTAHQVLPCLPTCKSLSFLIDQSLDTRGALDWDVWTGGRRPITELCCVPPGCAALVSSVSGDCRFLCLKLLCDVLLLMLGEQALYTPGEQAPGSVSARLNALVRTLAQSVCASPEGNIG